MDRFNFLSLLTATTSTTAEDPTQSDVLKDYLLLLRNVDKNCNIDDSGDQNDVKLTDIFQDLRYQMPKKVCETLTKIWLKT